MTNEEMRVAIAEACGIVSIDLNAMHEAEKTLTDPEYHAYERLLEDSCYFPTMASASIRAEAFLRVKGLWREDKPASFTEIFHGDKT